MLLFDPYSPVSLFFSKPLMEVPHEARMHFRKRDQKRLYGPFTKTVWPRVLKL